MRTGLLAAFFAHFALFGASAILVGAAVPEIIRDFAWSYLETGAVLSGGAVGYCYSTFLSGLLVQSIGPKKTLVGGLVLQATGLALIGQSAAIGLNLLAIVLVGLGEGGSEVATNFCLVRLETSGRSQLMNFMHAAFTAGAILGPLSVGLLLERSLPWQMAFQILGLLSLGMAVAFQLLSFTSLQTPSESVSLRRALGLLRRDPLLLLLTLIIFLYVGAEIGISNWIAEYFVQIHDATPAQGAYMLSVFWLGLLLGRLLVASSYRGRRQAPLLVGTSALATAGLIAALLAEGPWLAGACFLLSGMGFAAIYPVVVVIAGQHNDQGLAIGAIATGGGVGAFLFPFAMSALAEGLGIDRAFWFYVAISLALALAAGTVLRRELQTDI